MKHILHLCFICAAMSACTNANEESALPESSSPPTTPCTHINKTQAAEVMHGSVTEDIFARRIRVNSSWIKHFYILIGDGVATIMATTRVDFLMLANIRSAIINILPSNATS